MPIAGDAGSSRPPSARVDQVAAANGGEAQRSTTTRHSAHPAATSFALPRTQPIKRLMQAGIVLLQPPAPLPATQTQLLDRLKVSEKLFVDALGQASVQANPAFCFCSRQGSDLADSSPPTLSDQKTDHRQCMMLDRSCALSAATQQVLLTEFDGPARDPSWKEDEFLLGTADRRLLRTMVDLALDHLLLSVQRFIIGIREHKGEKVAPLHDFTYFLLDLCLITPAPADKQASSSTSTATTITRWLPATFITDYLRYSGHAARILLAAIVVGWLPTALPAHHKPLRELVMRFVESQPSRAAIMSTLATARLIQAGKPTFATPAKGTGWDKVAWPRYVSDNLTRLQSRAVGQPGGVKAFIRAFLDTLKGRSPSEKQISIFCRAVVTPPQGSPAQDWISIIITQACVIIVADPPAQARDQPVNPLHYAAALVIDACYTQDPDTALALLKSVLIRPLAIEPARGPTDYLAQTSGIVQLFSTFSNSTLQRSRCLSGLMGDTGYKALFSYLETANRARLSYPAPALNAQHAETNPGEDDTVEVLQVRADVIKSILVGWMEVAQIEELLAVLVDMAQGESLSEKLGESSITRGLEQLHVSSTDISAVGSPLAPSDRPSDFAKTGVDLLLDIVLEASCRTAVFSLMSSCLHDVPDDKRFNCLLLVRDLLQLDRAHEICAGSDSARPGDAFLELRGRCAILELRRHADTEVAETATLIDRRLASIAEQDPKVAISECRQTIRQLGGNGATTATRSEAFALLTRVASLPSINVHDINEIRQALDTSAVVHDGNDEEDNHFREWRVVLLRYLDLRANDCDASRDVGAGTIHP